MVRAIPTCATSKHNFEPLSISPETRTCSQRAADSHRRSRGDHCVRGPLDIGRGRAVRCARLHATRLLAWTGMAALDSGFGHPPFEPEPSSLYAPWSLSAPPRSRTTLEPTTLYRIFESDCSVWIFALHPLRGRTTSVRGRGHCSSYSCRMGTRTRTKAGAPFFDPPGYRNTTRLAHTGTDISCVDLSCRPSRRGGCSTCWICRRLDFKRIPHPFALSCLAAKALFVAKKKALFCHMAPLLIFQSPFFASPHFAKRLAAKTDTR